MFEYVTFHHLRQESNEDAHVLAREGRQFEKDRYWIEEAPTIVEKVVEEDRLRYNYSWFWFFGFDYSKILNLSLRFMNEASLSMVLLFQWFCLMVFGEFASFSWILISMRFFLVVFSFLKTFGFSFKFIYVLNYWLLFPEIRLNFCLPSRLKKASYIPLKNIICINFK